jgi:ribosomal protein S8
MWSELISGTNSSLMTFSSDNLIQLKKVDISEFGGYITSEEYNEILEDGCFVTSSKLQGKLLEISIADLQSYHRKSFLKTHVDIENNRIKHLRDRDLINASRNDDFAEITKSILKGADMLVHNSEPVVNAIKKSSKPSLEIYLGFGYSPNANNSIAFIEAVKKNDFEMFEILFKKEKPNPVVFHHVNLCSSDEIKKLVNDTFNFKHT